MLSALERAAADDGATRLYLLTTTAESFFGRFGYAPIPRASAPAEITDSAEFRSLCPASAAFLFKRICCCPDCVHFPIPIPCRHPLARSEERRVGKECVITCRY